MTDAKQPIPNGSVFGGLLDAARPRPPKRAHQLIVNIDGDQWSDIVNALTEIARNADRMGPGIFPWIRAGYSVGHTVEHIHDPEMTHERWSEGIALWLEGQRAGDPDPVRADAERMRRLAEIGELALKDWCGATNADQNPLREAIETFLADFMRSPTLPPPPGPITGPTRGTLDEEERLP